MPKGTIEEILITKIRKGIRKITTGEVSPLQLETVEDEEGLGTSLTRLKALNEGMYEELLTRYSKAVHAYRPANITASKRAVK